MKYYRLLIVLLAAGAELSAVNNPNVSSPVGSPTAVPSATRSSLVPSRPFESSSGNDIVTGNVGGMKHFRGVVPYSSSYYSSSSARSSVDDFIRRSYDPIANDRSPGQYRTYYEPRRMTGSSVRADGASSYSPMLSSQGQSNPYTPQMLPQTLNTQYSRQRPLSLNTLEIERILDRQIRLREESKRQLQTSASEEEKEKSPTEPKMEPLFFETYLQSKDLVPVKELPEPKSEKPALPLKEEQEILNTLQQEAAQKLLEEETRRRSDLLRDQTALSSPKQSNQQEASEGLTDAQKAEAAALLSRYKTFEQLAKARREEYLAAAELFLKEGKFYKAADTFALASIWAPGDARPLAGQAFALFAAGEYMSSAFCLSQAIVLNAEVASQKVNLPGLIGDRDVYENRLMEMTTWQERSSSGELAFLMAFVYHHDGKAGKAGDLILTAADQIPNDKAIQILRAVIFPDAAVK
jgi:hypothetical protein